MTNLHLASTIGRNTLFGIVASLVQIGTRLITVPIVIGYLGLDGYGVWSIIMAIAVCMRFGSVGVKSAFQKYVAEATGSGDFQKANQLLSTGSAAMIVFSISVLLPCAFFSDRFAHMIDVPDRFLDSTAGAISVLAVLMLLLNVGAVYEAIIMGAHRIDLTRKFLSLLAILETIAIVVCLHLGNGLLAMSAIMALSEVVYLICCYVASQRLMPAVEVSLGNLSWNVWRELVTYAGSYQIVSILEVLYGAILPILILKWFGADLAGMFAVVTRLVAAALIPKEALLLPILSAASLVHASGSVDRMLVLLGKSVKATLVLTMLPLAFVASHGPLILFAWTGQSDVVFRWAFWLVCGAELFKSLSLLALILYRASGRAWMDNVRQVLRFVALVLIVSIGHDVGFMGILGGLVLAEFVGMVFMFVALTSAFQDFTPWVLFPDTVKLIVVTLMVLFVGSIMGTVSVPWDWSVRLIATFKLGMIALTSLVTGWLALRFTGALSRDEVEAMVQMPSTLKSKAITVEMTAR